MTSCNERHPITIKVCICNITYFLIIRIRIDMTTGKWEVLQNRFIKAHELTGISVKCWCENNKLNYNTARRHIKINKQYLIYIFSFDYLWLPRHYPSIYSQIEKNIITKTRKVEFPMATPISNEFKRILTYSLEYLDYFQALNGRPCVY